MHDHGGDGAHHHDHRAARRPDRRLALALALNGVIVVAQVVFGALARSLGLIADAAHNLADVGGVAMALIAVHLARRGPTDRRSFGYYRATVLAAQANAAVMLVTSSLVAFEGVRRITNTPKVDGLIVVIVAAVATAANLAGAGVLGHDHGDVNMRAARLHLLADGFASAGVVVAGLIIWLTKDSYWIDPAVSIAIALWLAWRASLLLRETASVLLQTAPAHLDVEALRSDLGQIEGVVDIHDLHVWALAHEMDVATAHVMVRAGTDTHRVLDQARHILADRHRLTHATLQVEPDDHTGCEEVTW